MKKFILNHWPAILAVAAFLAFAIPAAIHFYNEAQKGNVH